MPSPRTDVVVLLLKKRDGSGTGYVRKQKVKSAWSMEVNQRTQQYLTYFILNYNNDCDIINGLTTKKYTIR
ncbi:hypothetical protein [uncultured Croceitalea sp.]|uniref:hypothetical protein n=1 Tax=uncultured Croceitalea sp. TaxID=1798908 RepID=UPI0033059809